MLLHSPDRRVMMNNKHVIPKPRMPWCTSIELTTSHKHRMNNIKAPSCGAKFKCQAANALHPHAPAADMQRLHKGHTRQITHRSLLLIQNEGTLGASLCVVNALGSCDQRLHKWWWW